MHFYRFRRTYVLVCLLLVSSGILVAQTSLRKIGELELSLTGLTATVDPLAPVIPKNVTGGVRIVVNGSAGSLSATEVARLLGGSFQVQGELSGPGLSQTVTLPIDDGNGGEKSDPLLLKIPALTIAGDYSLSNLRFVVGSNIRLDISPSTIPVKIIDQVLVSSVQTRPLTLDEIKTRGIVLDSSSYLGFEFTLGLQIQSKPVNITFPVVFTPQGVPVPQPISNWFPSLSAPIGNSNVFVNKLSIVPFTDYVKNIGCGSDVLNQANGKYQGTLTHSYMSERRLYEVWSAFKQYGKSFKDSDVDAGVSH